MFTCTSNLHHNHPHLNTRKQSWLNTRVANQFSSTRESLGITSIFDRCHRRWAAVTPVKNQCDACNLRASFATSTLTIMLREKKRSELQWPKLPPVHITTIIDGRQYMIRPETEITCIILYHEHAKMFIMYVFIKLLNHILEKMEYVLLSLTYISDIKHLNKLPKVVCVKVLNKIVMGWYWYNGIVT